MAPRTAARYYKRPVELHGMSRLTGALDLHVRGTAVAAPAAESRKPAIRPASAVSAHGRARSGSVRTTTTRIDDGRRREQPAKKKQAIARRADGSDRQDRAGRVQLPARRLRRGDAARPLQARLRGALRPPLLAC